MNIYTFTHIQRVMVDLVGTYGCCFCAEDSAGWNIKMALGGDGKASLPSNVAIMKTIVVR